MESLATNPADLRKNATKCLKPLASNPLMTVKQLCAQASKIIETSNGLTSGLGVN